jgi:N-acetylglucosaminyl-diphospho-decaprenol L-rhamnosyltransferase
MNKYYKKITIIIITYKSSKKVFNFIKKIPNKFSVIIVDNSRDIALKKKMSSKKNIKVYFHKNNGFGSSVNYAAKKIKTNYFFQISPDLEFNFNQLKVFYIASQNLNDKFSALGPRFYNVAKKSHVQSNIKDKIGYIKAIHGSAMFVVKKVFFRIGGFDKNIFLYFEENDYCYRGEKKGYKAYQLNRSRVKKKGQTVESKSNKEKNDLNKLLSWHFIWSKFYYYKKKNGVFITFTIFVPTFIRTIFKIFISLMANNKKDLLKYKYRFQGLFSSMLGKKSFFRI